MKGKDTYWNHNTAYHWWILEQIKPQDRVLDVGGGDGLLVQKLSPVCRQVTGIDPHGSSAARAGERVAGVPNASIRNISFEACEATPAFFDVIVLVASLHHMDFTSSI